MIKRFVYWLYMRVVYLPELKKKIKAQYPGVRISCKIKDLDRDLEVKQVQKAQWEREWIPDDKLN